MPRRKTLTLADFPDPSREMTQAELGKLLNRDQSGISRLISAGVLSPRDGWLTALFKYVAHLQEAAGRKGNGDLDLAAERARLARLQADKIAIELRERLAEVGHVDAFAELLIYWSAVWRSRLLALASKLGSRALEGRYVKAVEMDVREALTELSKVRFDQKVIRRVNESEGAFWGDIAQDLEEGLLHCTI
jgi:phage terminase Nu1 subunit (DNA packaging protein)